MDGLWFLDLTFCWQSNASSEYSGLLRTSIGVPAENQIQVSNSTTKFLSVNLSNNINFAMLIYMVLLKRPGAKDGLDTCIKNTSLVRIDLTEAHQDFFVGFIGSFGAKFEIFENAKSNVCIKEGTYFHIYLTKLCVCPRTP